MVADCAPNRVLSQTTEIIVNIVGVKELAMERQCLNRRDVKDVKWWTIWEKNLAGFLLRSFSPTDKEHLSGTDLRGMVKPGLNVIIVNTEVPEIVKKKD